MNDSRHPWTHRVWFVIFAAITFSVVSYGASGFIIEHNPTPPPRMTYPATVTLMRPLLLVAAVATLIGAVAWIRFRVDGKIGGEGRAVALTPAQFYTASIVALMLSEGCAILGWLLFLLGAPLTEFAPFAAGTLLVNFAFILPRGLRFWAAYDKQGALSQ